MTATLEKKKTEAAVQEVDKEVLCQKLCVNILEGLLEGYNELKDKNPEQEEVFQAKIEELKQQLQLQ